MNISQKTRQLVIQCDADGSGILQFLFTYNGYLHRDAKNISGLPIENRSSAQYWNPKLNHWRIICGDFLCHCLKYGQRAKQADPVTYKMIHLVVIIAQTNYLKKSFLNSHPSEKV